MLLDTFRADKGSAQQTTACSGLVTFCNQPDQGLGLPWLELDKYSGWRTCYFVAKIDFIFGLGRNYLF